MTKDCNIPPPPFDHTTQSADYQNWYEMISSIVNFVTASTHLASTLRRSTNQFPVQVLEESFNVEDFPWFLKNFKEEPPLVQYPLDQVSHGEPNTEPRTIHLIDTSNFGDSVPKETSNQSCFFQDFTDSEQTINSQNMQDDFELQELSEAQQVLEDLVMESNLEADKSLIENEEQNVNTTDHFLSRFCRITEELHKLSGDGKEEAVAAEENKSDKQDTKKNLDLTASTRKSPEARKGCETKKVTATTPSGDKSQKKALKMNGPPPKRKLQPKNNFITKNIIRCAKPPITTPPESPKPTTSEFKSCLKPAGKTIKPPKTCVIKENQETTSLKILKKDTTLKLTAAETVRRAAALLKDAEKKVLNPTALARRKVESMKGYAELRRKSLP